VFDFVPRYLKLRSFGQTMLLKVACASWPGALTHPVALVVGQVSYAKVIRR
jgi:hypothetical protein